MRKVLSFLREHFFLYLEDYFFAFLALIILFVPLIFFPPIADKYNAPKVSIFFIFLGLALVFVSIKESKIKVNKQLLWALGLFLLFGLANLFTSKDLASSIFGSTHRWIGFLFYVCLMTYILAFLTSLTEQRVKFILNLLIMAGLFN